MKVEFLVTIKLGDGKIVGKGTIMSEPFPIGIRKELDNPRKVPILRVIEEAKVHAHLIKEEKPFVHPLAEAENAHAEAGTTVGTPVLIPEKGPKVKKPKIKKAKLG